MVWFDAPTSRRAPNQFRMPFSSPAMLSLLIALIPIMSANSAPSFEKVPAAMVETKEPVLDDEELASQRSTNESFIDWLLDGEEDLSQPHPLEYTFRCPHRARAEQLAGWGIANGYSAFVDENRIDGDYTVTFAAAIVPTMDNLMAQSIIMLQLVKKCGIRYEVSSIGSVK